MNQQKEIEFTENLESCRSKILGRLASRADVGHCAEDIFQKAALCMWSKYDTYTQGTSFIAWAWTVTRNIMLNFLRAQKRDIVDYDKSKDIADILEALPQEKHENNDLRLLCLEDIISSLSKREKAMLEWVYVEGREVQSFAAKYNITKRTCFNTISLLRKKIKKQINERILLELY